jgi:hypothetical protein
VVQEDGGDIAYSSFVEDTGVFLFFIWSFFIWKKDRQINNERIVRGMSQFR